jgi:hypothetical protein
MQTLQAGRPLHIKVVTLLVEWTAGKCGSMSHILGPMHTATFLYFSLLPGARRIQIENGRQVKIGQKRMFTTFEHFLARY